MQNVQGKLQNIFKLREKNMKHQLKREILQLVIDDKLSTARSNEFIMEMLKFGLNEILYKREDLKDFEGTLKDYKVGSGQKVPLVKIIVDLGKLKSLRFALSTTVHEILSVLACLHTENGQHPFSTIMSMALRNKDLFSIIYEDPIISSKYVTEEIFMLTYQQCLAYLLYDAPCSEDQPLELAPLSQFLNSATSQALFKGFCSDRKATLIEQMLLIRGHMTVQLTELVKDNSLALNSEAYYLMQIEKMKYIFTKGVYLGMTTQPYSLTFFQVFQQVVQQFKQIENKEDEEVQFLDVLNRARDQLTDDDYELFIHEKPRLTLQLLVNFIKYGDSVTESFDQAVMPFVMKLKVMCDPELLNVFID